MSSAKLNGWGGVSVTPDPGPGQVCDVTCIIPIPGLPVERLNVPVLLMSTLSCHLLALFDIFPTHQQFYDTDR